MRAAILRADAALSAGLRGIRPAPVLVIALAMSGWYGVEMLLDAAAPRVVDTDPVIGLFGDLQQPVVRVEFWCFIAGWVLAAAVWLAYPRLAGERRGPLAVVVTAGVLLAPYLVLSLYFLFSDVGILVLCLLSTAGAVWTVQRLQRYRRMPIWLLLAGVAWGALVAGGFGGSTNIWYLDYAPRYAKSTIEAGVDAGDLTTSMRVMHDINVGLAFNAGLFEELGKGAGILLVFLVLRRYFDGVVSGVVLGAAIGLGFNLNESVEYTAAAHGGVASFQFFMRQSVGLLASHAAFTAVVGAGLGVARQLADRRQRIAAVAGGLIAGIGGHFACDVIFPWFGRAESRWFDVTPTLDTVVLPVLILIVVQAPIVVMYTLLVRAGGRSQAAGLSAELLTEADVGFGTVRAAEVPVLLSPARRFWLRITLLRRDGWAAYRAMDRLQQAQLELATQLWHRTRGETAPDAPGDDELRMRILRLRRDAGIQRSGARAQAVAA
ncbi:PrsW family intramembrane metalloprotease [Dactylosporangium sp. CS-033363]|uniref:PrsW family intramembrane metalloprotease n=1 Tax=Dactylosporangium sp. CS-033363 TaxID=3239935 RepID=UPI003D91B347